MAAISALFVLWCGPQWMGMPLSQAQPPKKCADTWQLGTATATRSSTAERRKVCVAPPVSRHANARGSTPSMEETKSIARMLFHIVMRRISVLWNAPAAQFCVAVADHVVMKNNGTQ